MRVTSGRMGNVRKGLEGHYDLNMSSTDLVAFIFKKIVLCCLFVRLRVSI